MQHTTISSQPRLTFRSLVQTGKGLVLPGIFDGLSGRLAQRAGFEAIFIGGFPLVGTRYGVPDIGLKGLADIRAGVSDILDACELPAFVDIDDGYGDAKNAVHTLHSYERLGVSAVMIEDQRWPKRCGHLDGKQVVPTEDMVAKLRAMVSERRDPETFIFARTDSRAVLGLDEALRRGEAYLRAGADGLFVEAPQSIEELQRVGREFNVPLIANPLEGGKTPILMPQEYHELGFQVLPYGLHLLMRVAKTIKDSLDDLHSRAMKMDYASTAMSFPDYLDAVGLPQWQGVEERSRAGAVKP